MVRNAADEQQVADGKRRERDLRTRELDDIRFVLSAREGRRLVWRWLGGWGLYESPEGLTVEQTYRNIGRNDAARALLKDINDADPEAFIRMQQEVHQEMKHDG